MPLHLLGKKSWHVYNAENVSRVRQDEADARSRREAAEQRMQAEDAAYRTALLRGEDPLKPSSSSLAEDEDGNGNSPRSHEQGARKRLRRRLRGEDDTDRDIRFAREDVEAGDKARKALLMGSGNDVNKGADLDTSVVDAKGHIRLFVEPAGEKPSSHAQRDGTEESRKKRRRDEEVSKMRLDDAAGYNDSTQRKPWYASNKHAKLADETSETKALVLAEVQDKDVWGNEDPKRKLREQNRIMSSDPFAAMQLAQSQLKQKERDRISWQKQQAREIAAISRADNEGRRRDRKHRRRRSDEDSLDGFDLDARADERSRDHPDGVRHKSRRHRHRSRSREKLEHRRTTSQILR